MPGDTVEIAFRRGSSRQEHRAYPEAIARVLSRLRPGPDLHIFLCTRRHIRPD